METIDYIITVLYLVAIVGVGLAAQRRATSGVNGYFLGNRKLPWWALGASGMSSNLDISGTMINTAFIFALGACGFFIEIRGGVTLILAFLLIFQGKWNRRAQVMTQAEWMRLRFGEGLEGDVARIISAVSTIIMTVAAITYFAIGSGKFVAEFLEIPAFFGLAPQFWAAAMMITLAMIYTVASGLYGVVWTDVFQSVLIFGVIIYVCTLAVTSFELPETFSVSVPLKEGGFVAVETTREQWTSIVPPWEWDFAEDTTYSIYNLFGIAIIFYLLKVTIEGAGGAGQYMLQRYFAASSDRDAGLLTLLWTFLLAWRWPFIMSIAIMGVVLSSQTGSLQDPETVLPVVINEYVPTGVKGLLIAGLMAAAMSTFDSTVNAGAAYWVNDIYKAYMNPAASERKLLWHGRIASILLVLLGMLLALAVRDINDIWGWITGSLGGGLLLPLMLRWYWWRLNGWGFAAGIVFGLLAALVQRILWPGLEEYFAFLCSASASLVGMVVVALLTQPTSHAVLDGFYRKTRPFGFWKPVRQGMNTGALAQVDQENKRDRFSTVMAVGWQLSLFLLGMSLIMQRWDQVAILLTIFLTLSVGLYFTWYRHLSSEVKLETEAPQS